MKTYEINGKAKPKSLHDIVGRIGASKYVTSSVDEYNKQLKYMNAYDLKNHCRSVGVSYSDNRDKVVNDLVKEFHHYNGHYSGGKQIKQVNIVGDKADRAKEILRSSLL